MSDLFDFLLNISSSLKSSCFDYLIITKNPSYNEVIIKLIKLHESTNYIKLPDPKALLVKDEISAFKFKLLVEEVPNIKPEPLKVAVDVIQSPVVNDPFFDGCFSDNSSDEW